MTLLHCTAWVDMFAGTALVYWRSEGWEGLTLDVPKLASDKTGMAAGVAPLMGSLDRIVPGFMPAVIDERQCSGHSDHSDCEAPISALLIDACSDKSTASRPQVTVG